MKHKTFICLSFFLVVIFFACSKNNNTVSQKEIPAEEKTTLAVMPIIHVENRLVFGLKISGLIIATNLIGLTLFSLAGRRAGALS